MHRKVRRFRFYAKREDLQAILEEFQSKFDVYYVPTYSDEGPVFFKDAASLQILSFGIKAKSPYLHIHPSPFQTFHVRTSITSSPAPHP